MDRPDPGRFSAITFDCYGTLVDWESGILVAMQPVLRVHGVQAPTTAILEAYARAEAAVEAGRFVAYREVLRRSFIALAHDLGFAPRPGEAETFVEALPDWDPFPDTVESLKALGTRYRLGIISNVDEDLFEQASARMGIRFDFVTTAQSAGAYKPSPRIFEQALASSGHARGSILHVAQSLFHDVEPARALGLATVHVTRDVGRGGTGAVPASAARADWTVPDLRALVALLGLS